MENKKLENLRLEIANLVTKYSEEKYKPITFVGGEAIIPPSGKLMGEEELPSIDISQPPTKKQKKVTKSENYDC